MCNLCSAWFLDIRISTYFIQISKLLDCLHILKPFCMWFMISQARSHWLGWSGFNLTTYTQFMQLRFNKLISSVALRTSFVKNATVF